MTHTLGRTPLNEGSALRRVLYLKTHNIHKKQAAMPPPGFETAATANVRLQNYALNRAATGIGLKCHVYSRGREELGRPHL
jgi:hypothetical protein